MAELFLTNADKGCKRGNDILIAELMKRMRAIQALVFCKSVVFSVG